MPKLLGSAARHSSPPIFAPTISPEEDPRQMREYWEDVCHHELHTCMYDSLSESARGVHDERSGDEHVRKEKIHRDTCDKTSA